jgi:hypothetical protein
MAFDQKTRNLLQRTVSACRRILDEEFAAQRRSTYAIYDDGTAAPLDALAHLPDEEQQTARLLRDRLDHLVAGLTAQGKKEADARKEAVGRLTREQAFTVLNRLAALRMAEERDIVLECVRRGLQSDGFELFRQQAGSAFGDQFGAYQAYLSLLFDELAIDLGVLFDRHDPAGLLFPRKDALEAVLKELGGTGSAMAREEITPEEFNAIWSEDETIGWIYQYYNDPDERKKMREESSAPRNSRELAVRNQFFTPRYVVEFLTDNTLGRLWYEMTLGKTQLKDQCRYLVRRPTEIFLKPGESAPESAVGSEAKAGESLSQEELLRQPVHIPHRPLKDPREIRLLDPACGSMHFGLYAFDLFTVIYDEAWEIAHGPDDAAKSAETFAPFVSFAASFPDKAAFLREVPRLVVEHNIHGIDIDPRAAQIAGLSLWLRAQRAWHEAGVSPVDRPRVRRSNIVCAEPMPGEKELLREFVEQQFPPAERPAFAFLLETVFDRMALAGEAGSLLRIEEEIRSAIAEAKHLWKAGPKHEQATLFSEIERRQGQGELRLDLSGITDEQFWKLAEQRIYEALETYANQAAKDGGLQRRLFADDAAQGFAFIDLCRKRYDVVVMNPPFGEWSAGFNSEAKKIYPLSHHDIMTAFVDRGGEIINSGGRLGAITSRTCFFLGSFSPWRKEVVLGRLSPKLLADLGHGVMDSAMVEAAAYVLEKPISSERSSLVCFRLVRESDPSTPLGQATKNLNSGQTSATVSLLDPNEIQSIPNAPFAYWATEKIRRLYATHPPFENRSRIVRQGGVTGDDERYLRLSWEIPPVERRGHSVWWAPFAKGGKVSAFYSDIPVLVKWDSQRSTFFGYTGLKHRPSEKPSSADSYFQAGLTWPLRATRFAPVPLPSGSIFTIRGYAILAPKDELLPILALGNSEFFDFLFKLSLGESGRPEYIVGILKLLPVPELSPTISDQLSRIALHAWTLKVQHCKSHLNSSLFCVPPLSSVRNSLTENINSWLELSGNIEIQITKCRKEIDDVVISLYNLDDNDLAAVRSFHGSSETDSDAEDEEDADDLLNANDANFISAYFDYLCGVCFGSWDIRYATGERVAPELPDPFAPLPVCPPGRLQNAEGLPARPEDVPATYPVNIPWDGILVDDPEHPLDLERRVREVIKFVWSGKDGGPTADAIEHEACEILGVKSLRDYFRKPAGFFADHLKRYSKSRRQAPIYWPLSTASGSYTLWIYYHRLTPDTLYKCIQQFVEPKRKEVDAELDRLGRLAKAEEIGTKERRQMESLEELRRELADFQSELEHWAPRWKPNLNDGVLITACPLWKLFRLPKWQKDLKACWSEMEKGDYDWAHLALTLWPDRVREKCRKDRSLAIAHGLEELCEVKAPEPKAKRGRKAKQASPAVQETGELIPEPESSGDQ